MYLAQNRATNVRSALTSLVQRDDCTDSCEAVLSLELIDVPLGLEYFQFRALLSHAFHAF